MLAELQYAHEEIVAWLDELEICTSFETPDRIQLTGVRWRLSQASRRRTDIIEEHIYPMLLGLADDRERDDLLKLKSAAVDLRQYSIGHVQEWTIEKIVEDWAGYRQASSLMRRSMRARIEEERRILYPLLGRTETGNR